MNKKKILLVIIMFFVCIIKTKAIYYSASGTGFTGLTKASCGTTKNCMYDTNNRIIMQARLYYVDNGSFNQIGDTVYYTDSNSYNLLNNKGLKLIRMTDFDSILTDSDKYEKAKNLIVRENGGTNGKTVTNAGKNLLEEILEYEYDDILRNDISTTKGYRLVIEPSFIVINPTFGNTKVGLITSRGKIIESMRNKITALERTEEELRYRNRANDVGIKSRTEAECKNAANDKYINMTYGCGYNVESLDQYVNKTCYQVSLTGNEITCKNYDKNNEETYKETYSKKTCSTGTTELDRKKVSKYGTLQVGLGTIKMYCKESTKVSLPGNILESQLRGSYFAWPTVNGKYDLSIKTEMDCDYVDEGGKSDTVGTTAEVVCEGNYVEYDANYCREKTNGIDPVCPSGTEEKDKKCYNLTNGTVTNPVCPNGTEENATDKKCYNLEEAKSKPEAKCPSGYEDVKGTCYKIENNNGQKDATCNPAKTEESGGKCYNLEAAKSLPDAKCPSGTEEVGGKCYNLTNGTTVAPSCPDKKGKWTDGKCRDINFYVANPKDNNINCPSGYDIKNGKCYLLSETSYYNPVCADGYQYKGGKCYQEKSKETYSYNATPYCPDGYTSVDGGCSKLNICPSYCTLRSGPGSSGWNWATHGRKTHCARDVVDYVITTNSNCTNNYGGVCIGYCSHATYDTQCTSSYNRIGYCKCRYTYETEDGCAPQIIKTSYSYYCNRGSLSGTKCYYSGCPDNTFEYNGKCLSNTAANASVYRCMVDGKKATSGTNGWYVQQIGKVNNTINYNNAYKCMWCGHNNGSTNYWELSPNFAKEGKCIYTKTSSGKAGGKSIIVNPDSCPSGTTRKEVGSDSYGKIYKCYSCTNGGKLVQGNDKKWHCSKNCDEVKNWTYYSPATKSNPTGWCIKYGGTKTEPDVCPRGYTKVKNGSSYTCVKCSSGTVSTKYPGKCRQTTTKEKNYCASGKRIKSGSKYICVTCKSNLAVPSTKNPGKCVLSSTSEKNYCASGTRVKSGSKYICVTCKSGTASTVNIGKCLTTTHAKDYCASGTSVKNGTKYICVTCKTAGAKVSTNNPGKCILSTTKDKNKCTSGTSIKEGSKYICVACKSNETVSTVNIRKCLSTTTPKICTGGRVMVSSKCYKRIEKKLNFSCPEGYNLTGTTCEKIYSKEQVSNNFIDDIKKIEMSAKLTGGTNKKIDEELVKYYDQVEKKNNIYTREVKLKIGETKNRYYNRILNTVSDTGTASSIIYDRKEGVISTSIKDSIIENNKLKQYDLKITNIKVGYNDAITNKLKNYTCHYTLSDNPTCTCPVGTKNAGMEVEDIYENVCTKEAIGKSCADLKVKLCDYEIEDKYCISEIDGSKKNMKTCINSGKSEEVCKIELGCIDNACMGECTTTERKLEQVGYKLERCNNKYCNFKAYCLNNSKNTTNSTESCIKNRLGVTNIKEYLNSDNYNRSKLENALRSCETTICNPGSKVIFRTVSLTNPFLTSDGKLRTPGDNWNSEILIDLKIKNGRGIEGDKLYQKDPIITIKLTPQDIKKIRANNKSIGYGYSDFDLKCLNNDKTSYCVSKLLHTNELELDIKYSRNCRLNMSSTKEQYDNCYNTEKYTATNICK